MPIGNEQLLEEAEDLILDLEGAKRKDEVVKAVAKFLDAIVPLDVLLPQPLGLVAERHDEVVFEFVLSRLSEVFKLDPAKRAERKQRRKQRREERRRRREEKRKGEDHAE